MTQTRQQAKQPSVAQPSPSARVGKTHPALLSQTELKKVAGGVGTKTIVVNTPRGTW